jgi:hypothetical protein
MDLQATVPGLLSLWSITTTGHRVGYVTFSIHKADFGATVAQWVLADACGRRSTSPTAPHSWCCNPRQLRRAGAAYMTVRDREGLLVLRTSPRSSSPASPGPPPARSGRVALAPVFTSNSATPDIRFTATAGRHGTVRHQNAGFDGFGMRGR